MAIRWVVGLGNPGPKYEKTRHNAGAWFVQALAAQYGGPDGSKFLANAKLYGFIEEVAIDNQPCQLMIPSVYMNHSGRSVSAIAKYYQLAPEEILIAHDELDFDAGTIRLKQGGGHGGHNGLRDIISALGSRDFYRMRIGIGHPGHKDDVTDYVLSPPSGADRHAIDHAIDNGLTALPDLVAFNRASE